MAERGWYFGKRYEANILHVDHYEHLLTVAWKVLGEKAIHVRGLDDFPGYRKNPHDDSKLVKFIADEIFSEADVLIAHNGNNFDQKVVQARMITHGFTPPAPYKQIDTKLATKRVGRFASNKLDDLCNQLDGQRKLKHGDFENFWLAVDNGDPKAMALMKKYNKIDVKRLEELYLHLRPWIPNHPSISLADGRPDACPKCGQGPLIKHKKKHYSKLGWKQQFQCGSCGGYSLGKEIFKPENAIQFTN